MKNKYEIPYSFFFLVVENWIFIWRINVGELFVFGVLYLYKHNETNIARANTHWPLWMKVNEDSLLTQRLLNQKYVYT